MHNPTLVDVIADLFDKSDTLDAEDVEFGDEDNTNVNIPVIGSISATVTYYLSTLTKIPYARISWSWAAPLMYDEDGGLIDPNDPDIQDDMYFDPVVDYMFGTASNGAYPVAFKSTKGSTTALTEEHSLGMNVTITVYAVTKSGIPGPTSTFTATVTKDTTPPGQPSTPTLTTTAATVSAIYDGLLNGGGAQPSDYLFTEVLAGTSNPPTTKVGETRGRGIVTFAATPGTTVYVRLVSYDTSYNASAFSSVVSIVVKSILDDTDLIAALGSRARVISSVTDPVSPGPISNGDWWFKLNAVDTTIIDNIYKRISGVWVQDTFNAAAVIAAQSIVAGLLSADSVLADNIKAGEIYAKLTTTGELKADAISTGVLNALITISGILRTAETGKRVVLDQDGIVLYDANDAPIIVINTNGESTFNGNVTASSLEVVGTMQLDSPNNRMMPASTLVLGAKVGAPSGTPTVINTYNQVNLIDAAGLVMDGSGATGRMSDGKFVTLKGANYIINNTNGTYNTTITGPAQAVYCCVVIGNYAYSFRDAVWGSPLVIWRTNLTTGGTASVSTSGTWPAVPASGRGYALGLDASNNLYIAEINSSGSDKIFQYSIVNLTGDTFSLTYASQKTIATSIMVPKTPFYRGSFDLGVDSFLIYTASTGRFFTYSTMAEATNDRFTTGLANGGGLGYYSGVIWGSTGGKIIYYDGVKNTVGVGWLADFAYTYYDTVGTVRETPRSPKVVAMIKNRARVQISVPGWTPDTSTVDSVNELRFYSAKTANGTMYAQGSNNTGSIILTNIAVSGATPPASSTFPYLTPASIKNDDSSLVISGDGTVRSKGIWAKMTKTTAGHNSGGGTTTASTLTQVSGFTVNSTDPVFTLNASAGTITINESGLFDIDFYARWTNFGSANTRLAQIQLDGTEIGTVSSGDANWCLQHAVAMCQPINAAQVLSFWIYSTASTTFNHLTNPSVAVTSILTNVVIRKVNNQ